MKKFEIKTTADFYTLSVYINTDLYNYVERNLDFKPFDVTIEKHVEHKTGGQLRGFWRLCEHIAGYLQDMTAEIWDKRRVAQWICLRAGHTNYYQEVVTAKSVALATKKEMTFILNNLIAFGSSMDIPDCTLTSNEEEAFNNYYGVEK